MNSLFDDDDAEDVPAVPTGPIIIGETPNYKELWQGEREKRLDLELLVYELKSEIRHLQEKLQEKLQHSGESQSEINLGSESSVEAITTTDGQVCEIGQVQVQVQGVEQPTLAATVASSHPAPKRNLFDSSDSEDETKVGALDAVRPIIEETEMTGPLSEWDRLAMEERERRKLKARQRQQLGLRAGRNAHSRRGSAITSNTAQSTLTAVAAVVQSAVDLQGLHLPSPPPPNSAAPTPQIAPPISVSVPPTATKAAKDMSNDDGDGDGDSTHDSSSFSSSSYDDSDDSGWDDDVEGNVGSGLNAGGPPTSRARGSSLAGPTTSSRAYNAAQDAHLDAAQLEAEVEFAVLAWARGKSVTSMLQTASSVFFGPLPEVSDANAQSPQEVRKTYLRVVRCCHPDKQPVEAPPRVRAQAAKVFSALSDAYSTYKQQVNE